MKKDILENKTFEVLYYSKKSTEYYARYFEKSACNLGLKESEAHILVFLYLNKEYNIASHIVTNRGYSKAYVSKNLKSLKSKGIIENVSFLEDKRFQQITITEKGLNICKSLSEEHLKIVDKIVKNIPKEDLKTFFNVIKKSCENLERDDLND